MSLWKRWGQREVAKLLDFSAGKKCSGNRDERRLWSTIDRSQRRGTTALLNRLSQQDVVWLADEVGMGKTFVALGAIALLRRRKPDARVLILLPSTRLLPKWEKELLRFSRGIPRNDEDWQQSIRGRWGDGRVATATSLVDLVLHADRCETTEVLGTVSSFSLPLADRSAEWDRTWLDMARRLGLKVRPPWSRGDDKVTAKEKMVAQMRTRLRAFDLVVIDESHALKHGLKHGAARNRCLGGLLGPSNGPRLASKLLFLTATPVETSYTSLRLQAEVLGHDSPRLEELSDENPDLSRAIAKEHVIRRVQTLEVPGSKHPLTKNQYRREWRHGGVETFDDPMKLKEAPLQRLVLAVVQRKVMESLIASGDRAAERFLPSFQSGMLSSFESFGETLTKRRKTQAGRELPTHEGEVAHTTTELERHGLDSKSIDSLAQSYRERFHKALPHPKMDAVAKAIAERMAAGEKALVFVRRVRTVEELAAKISAEHDKQLLAYLRGQLAMHPHLLDALNDNYRRRYHPQHAQRPGHGDDGSSLSFFGHFFRGAIERDKKGKQRKGAKEEFEHRAGAWFRTKVLQAKGRRWSTFFHDNHVAHLLGGVAASKAWAEHHHHALLEHRRPFVRVRHRKNPWTRAARFELWQRVAIDYMFENQAHPAWVPRRRLQVIRESLLEGADHDASRRRAGSIGDPAEFIGQDTLFTHLTERRARGCPLACRLWPDPVLDGSRLEHHRRWLKERTLRRELLASTLRLGRPMVDLWLCAAIETGRLNANPSDGLAYTGLIERLLALLDAQRRQGEGVETTWNSFQELASLADHHAMTVDVAMPDLADVHSSARLRKSLGRKLASQSPVLGLHGGATNPRGLAQFLLPGFPHVLVCTDILGEGQDMHTFCARVLHYGAASSASATEQRTGRVDRIRSLVHRRMARPQGDQCKLQVHYPHLIDTLEPVQLQRLYWRIDTFLHLMHEDLVMPKESGREVLRAGTMANVGYRPVPTKRLESSFEVQPEDLVISPSSRAAHQAPDGDE